MEEREFLEIHVNTSIAIAEARDPKGLYQKARRGELRNFTGIDSPYESPENPEIYIDTSKVTPEMATELVLEYLEDNGYLKLADELPKL